MADTGVADTITLATAATMAIAGPKSVRVITALVTSAVTATSASAADREEARAVVIFRRFRSKSYRFCPHQLPSWWGLLSGARPNALVA